MGGNKSRSFSKCLAGEKSVQMCEVKCTGVRVCVCF